MKVSSLAAALLLAVSGTVRATPTPGKTELLGPLTGIDAPLHPANLRPKQARYFGTDLGFSYAHQDKLVFLFGDTMAEQSGERIDKASGDLFDDMIGEIARSDWPDPEQIRPGSIPRLYLLQYPGTDQLMAIDPGHVFDGLKTPEAGFSNGTNEFAVLLLTKPQGCLADTDCDNDMTCDTGLGYIGPPYFEPIGTTLACVDGQPNCNADTMQRVDGAPLEGSGFCIDPTSSAYGHSDPGRVAAYALRQRIGIRNPNAPWKYRKVRDWMTNKFLNTTVATVECLPVGEDEGPANYGNAEGVGDCRRVLFWGRPGFTGVGATGRPMNLYLAYTDMPAAPDFNITFHYFTGLDDQGRPQFSAAEQDAIALDLDAATPGNQPAEQHDIVQHMSIVWVEPLQKWVMFYGGGIDATPKPAFGLGECGLLVIFAGADCGEVDTGNGAIRMSTADHPWGPWTAPQNVIVGGRYEQPGSGQFGPGGVLYHPACNGPTCAPSTAVPAIQDTGHGWFYGANIIEQWTRPAGGGVDLIWNASTWDPYRVVLFRTHINP